MKFLLAFVLGAVCVYALRRKPEAKPELLPYATTPFLWRDLERVDAV